MKYKLINKTTGEEHLCDKVTIDGFEYYISHEKVTERFEGYLIDDEGFARHGMSCEKSIESFNGKKVIATNNPNIDVPKVVDEVRQLAYVHYKSNEHYTVRDSHHFGLGYNKSQETYSFSEEDMIEFAEWKDFNFYQHIQDNLYKTMQARPMYKVLENKSYTLKELLQLWKEQQPKTLYYA